MTLTIVFQFQHLIESSSAPGFTDELVQLTCHTQIKNFFKFLGYGELLDSFPFLDRLMSTFIEHSKLNIFAEEFGKDLEQLDRLKSEAETNSSKEIELVSGRLIKKVIFISRFMPRLSIQMQEQIKSVLDSKKIVHQELQTELLELSAVKELFNTLRKTQEKEQFFRNILFPKVDGKQFDLEMHVECLHVQCNKKPIKSPQKVKKLLPEIPNVGVSLKLDHNPELPNTVTVTVRPILDLRNVKVTTKHSRKKRNYKR